MAYDAIRRRIVLFGGHDGNQTYLGDTWEWDGTYWIPREAEGPSPRLRHAMAFDAGRGVITLFGGKTNSGDSDQTWEWNGTAWKLLAVQSPAPRSSHAMCFDSVRCSTILFGGEVGTGGINGETWELSSTPIIAAQPISTSVCPAGEADFSVAATGERSHFYQWQWQAIGGEWTDLLEEDNAASNGSGLVISAWGTATSTVHLRRQSAGNYGDLSRVNVRCVVSNACSGVASDAALLTICPADFNCDGAIGVLDYEEFVAAFQSGEPEADFTRDGAIDFFDYDDFVVAMEAGC